LIQSNFRVARLGDLPAILTLLADDMLGATRDRADGESDPAYRAAFQAIEADPNQMLLIGEWAGAVIACLQLSYLPGLSNRGAWRAQVESVRVAAQLRGQGIGEQLMGHAIDLARRRGCRVVQLTTDKRRHDAHRFYERLGFIASHEGMKLLLA
jgi:GNAT superfamily N-acetyltransferase